MEVMQKSLDSQWPVRIGTPHQSVSPCTLSPGLDVDILAHQGYVTLLVGPKYIWFCFNRGHKSELWCLWHFILNIWHWGHRPGRGTCGGCFGSHNNLLFTLDERIRLCWITSTWSRLSTGPAPVLERFQATWSRRVWTSRSRWRWKRCRLPWPSPHRRRPAPSGPGS